MLTITILTLFPDVFREILATSILKKAREKAKLTIRLVNIRDFATDSYKTVDDRPYGGGKGMIMRVDILYRAIENSIRQTGGRNSKLKERVILLDPKGKRFNQKKAKQLATYDHLILICGHYEGVDARMKAFVDETISIGDYVLTGGEIPAMVLVDTIARLLPHVLPKGVTGSESFENNLLEYPQYTRPKVFKGQAVPDTLLSGNHNNIKAWRRLHQKKAT